MDPGPELDPDPDPIEQIPILFFFYILQLKTTLNTFMD